MVNRNASIIMDIMNKVYKLEACESTYQECPSNYEIANYKEDIDVEKEKLIIKIRYEKGNNE